MRRYRILFSIFQIINPPGHNSLTALSLAVHWFVCFLSLCDVVYLNGIFEFVFIVLYICVSSSFNRFAYIWFLNFFMIAFSRMKNKTSLFSSFIFCSLYFHTLKRRSVRASMCGARATRMWLWHIYKVIKIYVQMLVVHSNFDFASDAPMVFRTVFPFSFYYIVISIMDFVQFFSFYFQIGSSSAHMTMM